MRLLYRYLAPLLLALAFVVVTFGAYVRLSDAGLGCPDWPGCYGQIFVPATVAAVAQPEQLVARPLSVGKAWKEMIHRYLASFLGLLILTQALLAWRLWRAGEPLHRAPLLLVPLVGLQGLLGMWTVTLLLKPLVVTAHLLGGFSVVALLVWQLNVTTVPAARRVGRGLTVWVVSALVALSGQVFLGGWTSSNYAALACTDFPRCHGSLWPTMNFRDAFVMWRGLGVNYEFGVLDTPARTAIHFTHRLWAVVASLGVIAAAVQAIRTRSLAGRRLGWCILAALTLQVSLGITNVVRGLPLPVAVAHNGAAALLLGSLVTLLYFATRPLRLAGDGDYEQPAAASHP
ncbi:MAG: heme A synthase [Gammaproteobacteria bacterium]|nr:heme A synthase [Gammaproteobacteria bacterium]